MKTYPDTVLEQVPINFLLREAQKEQQLYAGMFSPLVRLLVTHFPHLCAVEDWLEEILNDQTLKSETSPMEGITCNHQTFTEALDCLISSPSKMLIQLQTMLKMPINKLLTFTDAIVKALPQMLKPNIPRRILDLTKKVWFRLHIITPRSLRLATINALSHTEKVVFKIIPYTDNDITVDPLIILRCDERVYRCPPVLEIILRILAAYMQACKVYLQNHMQTNPVLDNASQNEQERRDLKNALIAAQDSAVVQILLECCLPKDNEKESGLLDNLREVQCIICSFIHQMFIADPNLAKLVHFQGYPDDLLPVTVAGIPSIHICLDFVPELLSQPQRNKQIFAIKLMSYLSCQYALPKSLSIAKLAVSCMFTMIGVLEKEERADFFLETIPFLVKVCQAFPPLCEDSASLLSQVGRVCYSDLTASGNISESNVIDSKDDKNLNGFPCGSPEPPKKKQKLLCSGKNGLSSKYQKLYTCVKESFSDIVRKAVVTRNIYS